MFCLFLKEVMEYYTNNMDIIYKLEHDDEIKDLDSVF